MSTRRSAVIENTVLASLGAITAVVFWRTAFPTITWWDSSSYSLASATLGVDSPPGSLLLTLLGWPIARLMPPGAVARALNCFAGLLAAVTVVLVAVAARDLLDPADTGIAPPDRRRARTLGAALGALSLGFGATLWEYAIRFTPYILSAAFTALILWTMVRWWRCADAPRAGRWIALLAFLFGLDFSVHRTNALLIPAAVAWILFRRPRTLRSARVLGIAAAALIAGLSLQLLLVPMAAVTRSPLDFNDTSTLSGLWEYITLKRLGGGFLLDLWHRKSPIWSNQTSDLLGVLRDNFLHVNGPIGVFGWLPILAAIAGVWALARRDARLALGFVTVIVLQAAFTVLYFNIPANFFRTFDRHYLPVCVSIGVLVACGLADALESGSALIAQGRPAAAVPLALITIACPFSQALMNWTAHDASKRYFAHDYAVNALTQLPRNAIFFTVGDNDTFPLWYVQAVEHVRPDVAVINLSVANIPEVGARLRAKDPTFPVSLSTNERVAMTSRPWTDTIVTLPVEGSADDLGLRPGVKVPTSIALPVKPMYGSRLTLSEALLLDIARSNRWKRPLTFSVTAGSATEWFTPYARLEGIYHRIVPERDPEPAAMLIRVNLLQRGEYRGYSDPGVRLDDFTPNMAYQYLIAAMALLEADQSIGTADQCQPDKRRFLALLAPARWAPPQDLAKVEAQCE